MAFAEDLSVFVNTDTPGWAACVVNSLSVTGLFDNFPTDPLGIATSQPVLLVNEDDTGTVAAGDSITVSGTSYTVREVQPDGLGLTRLILEAA